MPANILAFALGVALFQQQAVLPEISWAWALLPSTVSAFLLWRCWIPIFSAAGKVLLVVVFLGAGFFWAAAFAQWRLADALPHEWERRDIQLVGVVAELPQTNELFTRFTFDVEQVDRRRRRPRAYFTGLVQRARQACRQRHAAPNQCG